MIALFTWVPNESFFIRDRDTDTIFFVCQLPYHRDLIDGGVSAIFQPHAPSLIT